MWSFWIMSVDIWWWSIDIELMLDIIIFLTIIIVAVYPIFKSKKNNDWESDKQIDNEPWIDDKKWLVLKNVKKNWLEYKNIKSILEATILFSFTVIVGRIAIIWLISLCFSLHNLLTNKFDSLELYHAFIFVILLLFCTLYFILIFNPKTLSKTTKISDMNFTSKLITLLLMVPIYFRISIFLLFFIFLIVNELNMDDISSLIEESSVFFIVWIWICTCLLTISRLFFLKHSSENDWHMAIDNVLINDEKISNNSLDKAPTYDELIDNNKKIEIKTWFHQWPLLE